MIDQASHQTPAGLRLGRKVIHSLRASLERDAGIQAATHLQEAGFAGGEELYEVFARWLKAERNVDPPSDLDMQFLGEVLSDFFAEQGWGKLTSLPLGEAVLALDSDNWAEALDQPEGQYPTCHLSCGLLADFLGRVSQGQVAVMEVECRSRGDKKCRFLAGAPETPRRRVFGQDILHLSACHAGARISLGLHARGSPLKTFRRSPVASSVIGLDAPGENNYTSGRKMEGVWSKDREARRRAKGKRRKCRACHRGALSWNGGRRRCGPRDWNPPDICLVLRQPRAKMILFINGLQWRSYKAL